MAQERQYQLRVVVVVIILSCGPGGLAHTVSRFKNIGPAVAAPLDKIFIQLLSATNVPAKWKQAVVNSS